MFNNYNNSNDPVYQKNTLTKLQELEKELKCEIKNATKVVSHISDKLISCNNATDTNISHHSNINFNNNLNCVNNSVNGNNVRNIELELAMKNKEFDELKGRLEKLELANYYFMSGVNYQTAKNDEMINEYYDMRNVKKNIKKNIFIKNKKYLPHDGSDVFHSENNCYMEISDMNTLEKII